MYANKGTFLGSPQSKNNLSVPFRSWKAIYKWLGCSELWFWAEVAALLSGLKPFPSKLPLANDFISLCISWHSLLLNGFRILPHCKGLVWKWILKLSVMDFKKHVANYCVSISSLMVNSVGERIYSSMVEDLLSLHESPNLTFRSI